MAILLNFLNTSIEREIPLHRSRNDIRFYRKIIHVILILIQKITLTAIEGFKGYFKIIAVTGNFSCLHMALSLCFNTGLLNHAGTIPVRRIISYTCSYAILI